MTVIICDSSSLILLAKLELLDLLIKSFKTVLIPSAVYNESLKKGKELKKLDAFSIDKKIMDGKIIVKEIEDLNERDNIIKNFNVHKGESESIILYLEKRADLLGTDDYRTLKVCKILGIKYFTTPLFLIRCYEKNNISNEITLLKFKQLKKLGGYAENLLDDFKYKIKKKEV